MANEIDRRANKNKRDLTPSQKARGAAIAKRNMDVAKAGKAAAGQGPKAVKKAMASEYMKQRGGDVTNRPGYDYSTGGSEAGDEYYLDRKPKKK